MLILTRLCNKGPFEVESTLKQHSAVIESAVVSSPDRERGEVAKAFIVLTSKYAKQDPIALIKELQDWCKKMAARKSTDPLYLRGS